MSASVELGQISRDLSATGDAWAAAGYPDSGPEHEAREAAFDRLTAWNAKWASR